MSFAARYDQVHASTFTITITCSPAIARYRPVVCVLVLVLVLSHTICAMWLSQDDKPYCEQHYYAKFGEPCAKCGKNIEGQPLVALGQKWHPECFTCAHCDKLLGEGIQVFPKVGRSFSSITLYIQQHIRIKRTARMPLAQCQPEGNTNTHTQTLT